MYTNSRVTFFVKGNEQISLEAMFGSENETVTVSYQEKGMPFIRGFLYKTAIRHIESGNWNVVHVQPIVA